MDKERLYRYLDQKYSSKSEIIPNIPLGEDADAIWADILQSRRERSIELPLTNLNGNPYWYILTSKMISASEVIVDELMEQENTAELHESSVATIEEIFYTGFMEGAQISVQDAMDFLQSGGEPESVEELILINSRQAAGFAAENMYHAIDSNYLHNLAYFLTEGLDNGSGDYRITDTVEIPSLQGEVVQLPPAAMIPEQTERFAEFLAGTTTHPLIKAAAAQAWVLAYRPFPEGNERLARLLSNVILIRAGYTFFGNISISSVLARTSYEYFRAIANILRTENGADLTYFLEYYLVALSAAVNDMRARREQTEQDVVEAEQKLAVVPLQAASKSEAETKAPKTVGNPANHTKHNENKAKVDAALDTLRERGYEQFTLHDLEAITGINRKYISKLLLPYEASERIIAVRKSRVGNIYAFKQSAPPEDDTLETTEQDAPIDYSSGFREHLITALEERQKISTSSAGVVARELLYFIQIGKTRFTSYEIAESLCIPNISARNTLRYYVEHNMIRTVGNRQHSQLYEFCFDLDNGEKAADIESSCMFDDETQNTVSMEYLIHKLREIADGNNERKSAVAQIFIRYLQEGKMTFKTEEISEETGYENEKVHKAIRIFREKGLIANTRTGADGKRGYHVYCFNVEPEPVMDDLSYSDEVMDMISMLEQSENSQKDRRIGRIIRRCLRKGIVTRQDYELEGEPTKMKTDMRFAAQLGLVTKVSSYEYKISQKLGAAFANLGTAQKYTLSALYDLFGDSIFSAEMVVANLDYSSSHVSGILHQFTMLKLLDCTPNEDNTYSYQLNVNPADNPECFEDVA